MKLSKIGVDCGSRSEETRDFGASLLGCRPLRFLFAALLFGGLLPSASRAASIGVSFNSAIAEDVDLVTGTAGAVAQANWNNTSNSTGTISSGTVIDSSGSTVAGMLVSWEANGAFSVLNANGTGEGDDTALMHGGLEVWDDTYTGDTEITLTNVPYARYDLYLYVNGWDNSERDGEAQLVVGGTQSGRQPQFDSLGEEFDESGDPESHSESTGTNSVGTYMLWENVTFAAVTIQARKTSTERPFITGLQIVEVAVPDISNRNIGVNFNSSTAGHVDLVTSSAGAVPQGNWNNVSNATGSVAGSVLEDSGSTLEGMSISWAGNAAHSVGGASGTGEGDDTALMHGGFEVQDLGYGVNNEITLTGVPYAEYDLYVYVSGWNAGRTGEAQLKADGGVVSGSQRQFQGLGTLFLDGTHTHSESTGTTDIGTYVMWEDLIATDVVIQAKNLVNGTQPLIVGLQIVKTPPDGLVFVIR